MKVYLIGVGMGNPATLTGQALEAIGDSPVLVGAPRLLEPWGAEHDCVPLIAAADIAAYVDKAPRGPVGVLLSGDTGFYSGAKGLWPLLGNHEVITIPGISSLSYFCARLQTTWQDARLVSAHGRSHNAVGEIQRSAKVFALTGGATKAEDICRALAERGLGQVRVSVGERLSYADERIVTGTAAELAGETFADLSVLLAVNPDPVVRPWNGSGLPDGAFLRGDVPMTKEEVRALAHDFAVVSLSDLLTPWEKITARLTAAAQADFVLCLYNPASHSRPDYLQRACDILLSAGKDPATVCGTVRNIGRAGEEAALLTLGELRDTQVDMFTTVFVGNSQTKVIGGKMVTPRGYLQRGE